MTTANSEEPNFPRLDHLIEKVNVTSKTINGVIDTIKIESEKGSPGAILTPENLFTMIEEEFHCHTHKEEMKNDVYEVVIQFITQGQI